ncbi:MAG: hypothetical protein KJS87_05820 [Alphaproteobacteria bacterium]|nr:hypothetical protein [Alphaproteobacteria bacterium]
MLPALIVIAVLAGLALVIRSRGWREIVYAVSDGAPHWFVAVRFREGEARRSVALPIGITLKWGASANFAFVGAGDCHFDRFLVLSGSPRDSRLPVFLDPHVEDAYVARVRLVRPPVMMLGLLRLLHDFGLRRMPEGEVETDPSRTGARPDAMPTREGVATLLSCPLDYKPAMVNFLRYRERAAHDAQGKPDETGRRAYARYGLVALETVYRTGGRLVFFGRVEETLVEAKAGALAGTWDDIGVMQYTEPKAILTMEQVAKYRDALKDRDAGLDATVIIASTADPG